VLLDVLEQDLGCGRQRVWEGVAVDPPTNPVKLPPREDRRKQDTLHGYRHVVPILYSQSIIQK
jgi:hypothetical protein